MVPFGERGKENSVEVLQYTLKVEDFNRVSSLIWGLETVRNKVGQLSLYPCGLTRS